MGPTNSKLALMQVMSWQPTGSEALCEAMMILLTNLYMRHAVGLDGIWVYYLSVQNITACVKFNVF